MALVARESEVKAHPLSVLYDEDEDLRRKSVNSPVFLQSPLEPRETDIKTSPAGEVCLTYC